MCIVYEDILLYNIVNCFFLSDCSRAPDCVLLGRETCSLDTPENTCGVCNTQETWNRGDWGNSSCLTVHTLTLASTHVPSTVQCKILYVHISGAHSNDCVCMSVYCQ